MRKIIIVLFLLISAVCLGIPMTPKDKFEKNGVLIIVDDIASDMIEKVETPNLDAIDKYTRAYVGGKKNSYSQTPTISALDYNSLSKYIYY